MVRVYPIIEPRDVRESGEAVLALIRSGIKMLQLRGGTGRELLKAGREIAASCKASGVSLVINDRVDIARLCGCGAHVGQDDVPPGEARKILGDHAVIGFSTHTMKEAAEALESGGADYLSVGPVFSTATKPDARPVVGTAELSRICAHAQDPSVAVSHRPRPPVVAIGGVNPLNYRSCLEAGAKYVAAIGCFRDEQTGRLRDDAAALAGRFR